VVADAVRHVAGVKVLPDLQRILLIFFNQLDLLYIRSISVFFLPFRGWGFGSNTPQNPVSPGRFSLLTAKLMVTEDAWTESREDCFSSPTKLTL